MNGFISARLSSLFAGGAGDIFAIPGLDDEGPSLRKNMS